MAWTTPTAVFFAVILAMLVAMSLWNHYSPPLVRRGFLGIETDRGTRLYIALLAMAAVLVIWLAVTDVTMWAGITVAGIVGGVVMRWG